jgi:two-component sensor histidine kinase
VTGTSPQWTPVPLSEIYITNLLSARPQRPADYLGEKVALQDLTRRMSHAPDEVLPRFVELAMQLTGGVSAGLSVLEPEAPKTFRWRNLCGTLSAFEGSCTPRDDSPCGVTLDENRPVLTRYSERGYQWIADSGVVLPEVLLVPLFIEGPEPLGTLWVVSNEEGHFNSTDARVATELASFVGIALKIKRNDERLRSALETQALLAREMSHRLKNVFAVTQSIVRLSAKDTRDKNEMAAVLSARLNALAGAHALVLPSLANGSDHPLDLASVLDAVLKPLRTTSGGATRFVLLGPSFECNQNAVSSIALVIHELATNAVKYGALSTDAGRVDLSWHSREGFLSLNWQEFATEPIFEPAKIGFGSKLVEAAVRALQGTIEYHWRSEGLSVAVQWPESAVGKLVEL